MHHQLKYLLVLLVMFRTTQAQISPGKLSQSHHELESIANCTKCHELGEAVSDVKCLSCHTAIASRINNFKGYHKSLEVQGKPCAKCHSEHHGLEFKLVFFTGGMNAFNHNLTGMSLEGKHVSLSCRQCHKPQFISAKELLTDKNTDRDSTFLGLNGGDCISCHRDEHGEQLTDKCLDCHNYSGWKPASLFKHEKTAYPLTGEHRQVECLKCHPLQPAEPLTFPAAIKLPDGDGMTPSYSGVQFASCVSCHEDVHNGKFGADCQRCHETSGFKNISNNKSFDHTATGYPLQSKHAGVACAKCHVSGSMIHTLEYEHCTDCHADYHHGQFTDRQDKGACESCHSVDGFTPARYDIEAHANSRYPLTGSHLAVPCFECHKPYDSGEDANLVRYDFDVLTCKGCHADAHQGTTDEWIKRGGCEYCHVTESWRQVRFDHDLSSFKLTGRHSQIECGGCHRKLTDSGNEEVIIKPLPAACAECHTDIHLGQFKQPNQDKTACDRCHTPVNWLELTFDHSRDSRFILEGAHLKVDCTACHKVLQSPDGISYIGYKPLPVECAECHGTGFKGDKK